MLKLLEKFLTDPYAEDMYITGQAGTGKTTLLHDVVGYCIVNNITYQVCAYTHNACDILRAKIAVDAIISTLHSYLKKRPTINVEAIKLNKVEGNSLSAKEDNIVRLLIIDEFSMIGEKDVADIRGLQYNDEYEEGELPAMKVLWIGDPNQLPPVKDMPAVIPKKPYWEHLTVIYRQAKDNPLMIPLQQLVSFIEGAKPYKLVESDKFIRSNINLLEDYKACDKDKVFLAYTNERVQQINFSVAGKDKPDPGDKLFSPTAHKKFTFISLVPSIFLMTVRQHGGKTLSLGSKWKTLEYMMHMELCEFYELEDEMGKVGVYPVIFGTKNYNNAKDNWAERAVSINRKIEGTQGVPKAIEWARNNPSHQLARDRAAAWRTYMCVKGNTFSMDFAHAKTVHKAQGTTVDTVFLDAIDLEKCLQHDYILYCKLFYVALSRASNMVITN